MTVVYGSSSRSSGQLFLIEGNGVISQWSGSSVSDSHQKPARALAEAIVRGYELRTRARRVESRNQTELEFIGGSGYATSRWWFRGEPQELTISSYLDGGRDGSSTGTLTCQPLVE